MSLPAVPQCPDQTGRKILERRITDEEKGEKREDDDEEKRGEDDEKIW